jgi:glycosyltransferase involved in cell wall biosynthesis
MGSALVHVLMVHAQYTSIGGEESVFDSEANLLERNGHKVTRHIVQNSSFFDLSEFRGAAKTIWNQDEYRHLRQLIHSSEPDVVHFHNTFPSISPSGYFAAHTEGVPVVQSLHNFRTFCVNAICFRDNAPCEDCLTKKVPWPGVLHRCHPRGLGVSASVATMIGVHRVAKTWNRKVNVFINVATQFSRSKLIAGGIPENKIVSKPNFLDFDPGFRGGGGGFALFVGRLSAEKGITTLLEAWERVSPSIPLKILGRGPLETEVTQKAATLPNVDYIGHRPLSDVVETMGEAAVLLFPSQWYEGMPRTIIESLAVGTPIIASDLGGMPEMVRDGETGLLFPPGDSDALANRVHTFMATDFDHQKFRQNARHEFEMTYTAEQNLRQLEQIYQRARADFGLDPVK